jgi:hypothetical protein
MLMQEPQLQELLVGLVNNKRVVDLTTGESLHLRLLRDIITVEQDWRVVKTIVRYVVPRVTRGGRARGEILSVLMSALSLYVSQVQDAVFDQMKSTPWQNKENMLEALQVKLDYLLRVDVIEKLASSRPTQQAVAEFQELIRPAVEREMQHSLKGVHRGLGTFESHAGKSPRAFLQAVNHTSLSAFLPTAKPIGVPSILAYGCMSADDWAVTAARCSDAITMLQCSAIGGGNNMQVPTSHEVSFSFQCAGRIRVVIVQGTVAWLGGAASIAAFPYRQRQEDGAYLIDWLPAVREKGGLAGLHEYFRTVVLVGARQGLRPGLASNDEIHLLLDALFPTTSEDVRDFIFLEHIVYAAGINEATSCTTSKAAQESLALQMRSVLAKHGGSQGVFAAMEKTSVRRRLAFVSELLFLCNKPENAVLSSSMACVCRCIINSVSNYGHAFVLMASLDRLGSSDRVSLNHAVSSLAIPKQDMFNVASADGLGGSFSVVFEVLGDSSAHEEVSRLSQKLKACGLRSENTVFVRMIHWIIREIEDSARFALLDKCHHIVLLPFDKVVEALKRQGAKSTASALAAYFCGLSMRALLTDGDSIWSDTHFTHRFTNSNSGAFGNWPSWSFADRGPEDIICTAVTTCVLGQVRYES